MPEPFFGRIIPIPLRADFIVRLHIPDDLTPAEAAKFARVALAYAATEAMTQEVEG